MGAVTDRLNDWAMAWNRSGDQDLNDLRKLKDRARYLLKNTPFGARYSQILVESVVGPNGIRLQAKNTTNEGKLFTRVNQSIEQWWATWCRPENCTVEKRLSFDEALSLAVATWAPDGEILIRLYRGPRFGAAGFAIQVLDSDFLDETWNQNATQDGTPTIRKGVEVDEFGAPVAYWLWTRHPLDSSFDRKRVRVPAADIIHAFIPMRPGQTRGIPHASAVLTTMKMLDGALEAELVAMRIESSKMGALVDADPQNPITRSANAGEMSIPAEAEPASLLDLRGTGAKLDLWDPQHPSAAVGDFTKLMTRMVAIGLGMSYNTLSGDLSDTTYSSAKIGLRPEQDHWQRLQSFVIVHICDRIYREALKMALLNGQIPAIADFDHERWTKVVWQPRGFQSPDPLKDIEADLTKVRAGVMPLADVAAKDGYDLEEVIAARKDEIELFAEAGIECDLGGKPAALPPDDAEGGPADQKPGLKAVK
jgi:lambda family phage portal protein